MSLYPKQKYKIRSKGRHSHRRVAGYYHFALVGIWGVAVGMNSKGIKPKTMI